MEKTVLITTHKNETFWSKLDENADTDSGKILYLKFRFLKNLDSRKSENQRLKPEIGLRCLFCQLKIRCSKFENQLFLLLSNFLSRPKKLKSPTSIYPKSFFAPKFNFFFDQNLDFVLIRHRRATRLINSLLSTGRRKVRSSRSRRISTMNILMFEA